MASKKCSDLIRQANSSRIKYAYTALVEIRKNHMKTPKDVTALVGNRLVQRLLDLIRSRDSLEEQYRSKVIDIALSILGNMCMEGVTRKQVLKDKKTGVTILVELYEEVESDRLLNRACRCLSNMLLDPGSWELVCCSSVIEKIVKVLQDTEKDEFKQTCIRAIRLIGRTSAHVQKLVEKNAISVVSKLIDSDEETLKMSALRCLHCLSVHGCTLQFARQVIASGKISYLLSLVKDSNIEAFQIVTCLCEHHNFRAEFGNSGGITMFYEMFTSKEPFWEFLREDLLSVLCLCCKEAVNRVKLRDENILLLFIQSLGDVKYKNLHARIISALVCFLYDETSFDVLLENGLVPLLINHLRNDIMQENDDENDSKDSCVKEKEVVTGKPKGGMEAADSDETKQTSKSIDVTEDKETKLNTETNIPEVNDHDQNTRPETQVESKQEDEVISELENKFEQSEEKEETEHVKESDEGIKTECKISEDDAKTIKRPVYSIDSPSYKSNVEWELEDYQGAKCIERFTPPHLVEYSQKGSYSPLSNSSYYSPGESSPEYSPPSSPCSSSQGASRNVFPETSLGSQHYDFTVTGSQSPENFHPKYPGINCKMYGPILSPATSPESAKRSMSSFSSYLSSPERDLEQEDVNESPDILLQNSYEKFSDDPFTSEECHNGSALKQKTLDCSQSFDGNDDKTNIESFKDDGIETFGDRGNENFLKKLCTLKETLIKEKRNNKRKRVPSRNNVTEYNILVLLSRVSQMSDPTMHLVTKEVLEGLFDYMSTMELPLARCPRLLSRVFRNPLCFKKLLTLNIPMLIFDKFLRNEDLNNLTKDLHEKKKIMTKKSIYGKAEIKHEVSVNEDRFSFSDDSVEEEQSSKRRKVAESTDVLQQSLYFKGQFHKQEEDICNVRKSAMAFLEDLSGIVDVNYGLGAIDRLLYTVKRDKHVQLCINILAITWTQASRQYFFNQREILDQVLSVLQPSCDFHDDQFVQAVNAVRLLVNAINSKKKYQTVKRRHSVRGRFESSPSFCRWEPSPTISDDSNIKQQTTNLPQHSQGPVDKSSSSCCISECSITMDTLFVVKNEKIPANRTILVEKSEIFAAMLDGHYSEAQQSEIKIPETSKFAFKFMIHYLHGCKHGMCSVIDQLFTKQVDKKIIQAVCQSARRIKQIHANQSVGYGI